MEIKHQTFLFPKYAFSALFHFWIRFFLFFFFFEKIRKHTQTNFGMQKKNVKCLLHFTGKTKSIAEQKIYLFLLTLWCGIDTELIRPQAVPTVDWNRRCQYKFFAYVYSPESHCENTHHTHNTHTQTHTIWLLNNKSTTLLTTFFFFKQFIELFHEFDFIFMCVSWWNTVKKIEVCDRKIFKHMNVLILEVREMPNWFN